MNIIKINEYIEIGVINEHHIYYFDDKLKWCYRTENPLEFLAIIYFFEFKCNANNLKLNIPNSNKRFKNRNEMLSDFYFWITKKIFKYEKNDDKFKIVKKNLKTFNKSILDILKKSNTYKELYDSIYLVVNDILNISKTITFNNI